MNWIAEDVKKWKLRQFAKSKGYLFRKLPPPKLRQ